ncbi:MAG: SDR family oxidoreductase [Bacteroidales bacterium]
MMKNVALITGASSGIGKELAIIHAGNKGDLILVARREKALQELKTMLEKQYGVQVKIIAADLTHPQAPQEVYDTVAKEGIVPDILINNAGFGGIGKFWERPVESDLDMIRLNILALTWLTRLFLPDFVKRGSGRILNVSSTASLVPGPLQAVYYATKAYVTSFSNALSEELRNTGVTITSLMPGATDTEFGKVSGMDKTVLFDKTASARTVAEAGYKAMIKGKMNVISGVAPLQKMMFFFLPFTPKKIALRQVRKMQEVKN